MAKRKRRKGGGGSPVVSRKVRRTSRRSGFGGGGGGGFSIGTAVMGGVTVGGAAIGINALTEYLTTKDAAGKSMLPESFAVGTSRALLKAGLGVGLAMLAKRFGFGKYATAVASGGIALATLDIYAQNRAKAGLGRALAGVDYFDTGQGVQGFPEYEDVPQYDVANAG